MSFKVVHTNIVGRRKGNKEQSGAQDGQKHRQHVESCLEAEEMSSRPIQLILVT